MKYAYTSYDYSKILDLSEYNLKIPKDYFLRETFLDEGRKVLILKYECSDGVKEITINVNDLIDNNEQTKISIRVI